jgi:Protein of unknown function (DUF3455)
MSIPTSRYTASVFVLFSSLALPGIASAQTLPETIAAASEKTVLFVNAEGAQVYECKADTAGKLAWSFREPVATLLVDGKTVGRHYTGPHWELEDGSVVQGKVVGRAPGVAQTDIPLLKLEVSAKRGKGQLSEVTTIQRLNTRGGVLEGTCVKAGAFRSVAYSADYVFLKK